MEPLDRDSAGHYQWSGESYAERVTVLNPYRSNTRPVPRLDRPTCLGVADRPYSSPVLINDTRSILSQAPCNRRLNQRLVLCPNVQLLAIVSNLRSVGERDLERDDVVLDLVRNDFA
ncbi:hypothetical protein D3C75_620710 [compost metagenome]